MITLLEESQGNVLGFHVSGKATGDELKEKVEPIVEDAVDKYGSVNLVVVLNDFQGYDISGFWEELKMGIKHHDNLGRVAIVGDKKWEEIVTKLARPFDEKYFDMTELKEAWEWVEQPKV